MVDIRQLNPQQLSEVNQRLETEISVLNNCHAELVGGKLLSDSLFLFKYLSQKEVHHFP